MRLYEDPEEIEKNLFSVNTKEAFRQLALVDRSLAETADEPGPIRRLTSRKVDHTAAGDDRPALPVSYDQRSLPSFADTAYR